MPILNDANLKNTLASAEYPIIYINNNDGKAEITTEKTTRSVYAVPNITAVDPGDSSFKKTYGTKYCYYAGAMANGIASAEMVIALGKSGFMGSYGSGGLSLERISADIDKIQSALFHGEPYMINMLSSRNADAEWKLARLFIEKNVHAVEASAFIMLSEPLVYYRLHGLTENKDGSVNIPNKVLPKFPERKFFVCFQCRPIKK